VAAFEVAATQKNSGVEAYKSAMLRSWMEVFVGCYVGEVQGICLRVAKADYLRLLAKRVDDVKFVGIAVSGQEVEKQEVLAQIFVMPDVKRSENLEFRSESFELKIGEELAGKILQEQRSWATRDRSGPKIPAQKVLTQSKNKAVLLGAPGSGKTTLASYFALMLCEQVGNDPTQIGLEAGEDWLPVVIRIRDWVLKPELSVLKYLRWYAEDSLSAKALPIGFFEHWLERGRALILLDGLDELVDEGQRRSIAEQIETFLGQYEDCPAVITSRPAGYRWDFFNLEAFPHYTLEPFDEKQVDTFIDHWYDSREVDKAAAKRRKEDLRSAFKGNDRIRNLATNPLLLTIIALIHRYQAELPRRRFKLYESAVETLLTSWDSGKDIKLYSVLQHLKSDDLLYVLKKLAYWIHTQGSAGETDGGTLIDTDELMRQLQKEIKAQKKCESHEAKAEAKRFVDFIQRRTGLLNEQGKDRYAFVHKTFQEYLTAEEIYDRFEEGEDEVIEEHIQAHLHDQHWREVLLLLVSKLKKKRAERAIEVVLRSGSEYEKWLHRDLLFAGWCLTEDPEGLKTVAEGLVGEILDGLVAIEVGDRKYNGYETRAESAKIIKHLSETSVEEDMWDRLKAQERAIDRFRLLEFQASLGQEREAIETLLSLLKDDDSDVRDSASESLGKLGNASVEVLSELLNLLKDDDSNVRESAAIALGELENATAEVLSGLLNLLKADDSDIRFGAVVALGELKNASAEVLSGLLNLLKDDDLNVRFRAGGALVQLGSASPELVSLLLNALKDDDPNVRFDVARVLGDLGYTSQEVLGGLLNALKDDDLNVRAKAAVALGKLGSALPEVLSGLLNALKDDSSWIRADAAVALVQLRSVSPEVLSELLSLLKDDSSWVRVDAAVALIQLRNVSPEVLSELLNLLKENDSRIDSVIRSRAASALVQLGKKSIEVLPALVQWIDRQPDDVPIGHAIDALRSILE
jgi:HEAT repeat protein